MSALGSAIQKYVQQAYVSPEQPQLTDEEIQAVVRALAVVPIEIHGLVKENPVGDLIAEHVQEIWMRHRTSMNIQVHEVPRGAFFNPAWPANVTTARTPWAVHQRAASGFRYRSAYPEFTCFVTRVFIDRKANGDVLLSELFRGIQTALKDTVFSEERIIRSLFGPLSKPREIGAGPYRSADPVGAYPNGKVVIGYYDTLRSFPYLLKTAEVGLEFYAEHAIVVFE
jgi:hypothetical protein